PQAYLGGAARAPWRVSRALVRYAIPVLQPEQGQAADLHPAMLRATRAAHGQHPGRQAAPEGPASAAR
ncbi:hypothetical protein NYY88_19970, partial [Acinetobacter baumannii]|nr:hypothetical protein [Acinetobacter baumannii]